MDPVKKSAEVDAIELRDVLEEPPMTLGSSSPAQRRYAEPAFLTVPTDILAEIASHLLPLDILQLARISKTLNDLLMSKNSKHIWRAARSNTDLPECPDNLSEPMYAALVYENICQKCGCRTDIDPSFALRMRLCRTCYVLSVKRGYYLLWSVMRVKHHILIFAIVPNEELTSPDDIDFELGTVSSGGKCISSDHFSRNNHCASQLREVVKQFEALQEYPDRLKAYAKACYLRKLEIDRHAKEMKEWLNKRRTLLEAGSRSDSH